MKKRIKLSMALIATLLTVTLSSCYIENDGPVGPSGENGWSDIKVITYNIYFDQWKRDNSELNYWYHEYYTNIVDYYVVDKGTVLFYYGYIENDGFVNKWFSIPFTNVYFDEGSGRYYNKIYDAMYSQGKLEIEIRDNNSYRFDLPDSRDIRIKAVILEGTLYNKLKTDDVDLKSFNALMNAVNISDNSTMR